MKLAGGERPESRLLYALAGVLMIAGPLWWELFASRYPLRLEWFVLLLVAAFVGLLLGVASRLVGGVIGSLAFAGLLFVFIDLQFDVFHTELHAVLLALVCMAAALILVRHRAAIVSVALTAFYLTSLVRPGDSSQRTTSDAVPVVSAASSAPPLLVHVIMDELLGVGGFNAIGDTATAHFLTDFYESRGFELYSAAYSRYRATRESVPELLSLGQLLDYGTDVEEDVDGYPFRLLANAYFTTLESLGYTIRVHQSKYLDLCADTTVTVVVCYEEPYNSIGNFGLLEGRWTNRALGATKYFLTMKSRMYAALAPSSLIQNRAVVGGGLSLLRRAKQDIAAHHDGGTAYFIHTLVPHRPLQVDSACQMLDDRFAMLSDLPRNSDDARWREILRLYAGQVRCGHRYLGEVLDVIDRTVGRDHAIVIVHGDHGSRLYQRETSGVRPSTFSPIELNAAHSTMLAVRRPGVRAAVHDEPVPLQDFIWRLAASRFMGNPTSPWLHEVRWRDSSHTDSVAVALNASNMPWVRYP